MSTPTVVVTGASTGIGAACVEHLAARGFRVVAAMRTPEALPAHTGARVLPMRLDVTDDASIRDAAHEVQALVGEAGLAGLVNNAGIAVGGPLEVVPIAELRRQLETNVVGQVAVTQAFLPLLRVGRGRIVMMGSVSGIVTVPGLGAYAASKYALEAVTDAFRQELHPEGLRVSIVEPGAIATPIWNKSVEHGAAMAERIAPASQERYAPLLARLDAAVQHAANRALPTSVVTEAVHHALTAAHPRTRYLIGADARLQAVVRRWLPDRWGDAIVRRAMGL
jgi:NAD(P)-dependent dehydrogenase (short-subunit alcohol dehydrogenase family)